MNNPYLTLTDEFNEGRLRAIICSGQAVVLHKLAIMSKDGDWILREEPEALEHVLKVLETKGASYRFGAPLDIRWMAGGWSAHFEFRDQFRVRCDFFTRPPRIGPGQLEEIWKDQEGRRPPFLDAAPLAEMKKTNREKDYVVIGELSRLMTDPREALLYSRSPRDIRALVEKHPRLVAELSARRPVLQHVTDGEEALGRALDEERRDLIRRNERRLQRRIEAARPWQARWADLAREISGRPLREAHKIVVQSATGLLPETLEKNADE